MKARAFFSAGMGVMGAQVISLLCLPLLTRLYEPVDFAPWAIGLAVVVFIGSIATLRYDLALVIERNARNASALFWLMHLTSLTLFFCTLTGMWLAAEAGLLFHQTQIEGSVWLVAVWLLLFMFTQIWSSWHLHHGAFLLLSVSQIANALATNGLQLYGAMFQGGGGFWLVLGSIAGQMLACCVLLYSGLRDRLRPSRFTECVKRIRPLARKHRRFVQYSLPYTFFGAIRDRVPLLLLGLWVSSRELGLYSQAWRLSNVPAGFTGGVIRPVLFHAVAEHGLTSVEVMVTRVHTILVCLGVPLLALLIYSPEDIFGFLLGDRWRSIGPMLAILSFPALAFSLSNWMDRLLDAAGKQHLNLWTEMVAGATSTLGLVLMVAMDQGILAAVKVQSLLLTLNYLFFMYLTYRVAGYRKVILIRLLGLALVLFFSAYWVLDIVWLQWGDRA